MVLFLLPLDGVVPLRKQSAKFRSKSFEEDESGRESHDRISSGISSYLARERSRSHSPTPRQDSQANRKIGWNALGKVARIGPKKVPNIDLTEHTKKRALTFKTICKAIIGFIRQEKLLRVAIGPVKLQQPNRYNLKRLKNYVDKTKAFTDALSKTKEIEIQAPGTKAGRSMAEAGKNVAALVGNVQRLKKLTGKKKGGFVNQNTQEPTAAAVQGATTPGSGSVGPPGRPTRDEGYSSTHDYERDRRFPPDFRYDGYPRDPRDRYFREYPYHGRYTPPWEVRYREEYEDFIRRERDQGYDTMRSRDRQAFEDNYRREMDSDRNREYYRRKLAEEDNEDIQIEYNKVPHGERYKLPPTDYTRSRRRSMRSPDGYPRNRSYSPAEDKSLRFQDSSPEDTQRSRRERGDGMRSQRDSNTHRSYRSPEDYSRKEKKGRSERRKLSPENDTFRERNIRTPEEYRWGRGKEEMGRHSPRHMQALRYSRSFDRNYRGDYGRYVDPREEAAKMRAIVVYADAMGGVNDEGGWSCCCDKGTLYYTETCPT